MKYRHLILLLLLCSLVLAISLGTTQDSEHEEMDLAQQHTGELVVLVHGLGRTELSMLPVSWALQRNGYEVLNWGYSSLCCSIDELGEQLAKRLTELEGPRPHKIHFIGHSMGNIIVRWMLTHDPPAEQGRVVMLAPPNNGAQAADKYVDLMGWILEPLEGLTTREDSIAQNLDTIKDREVGVIAGKFDGKVTLEEARHGADDEFKVVASAHTFIMNRSDVHRFTLEFLQDGDFEEDSQEPPSDPGSTNDALGAIVN